MGSVKEIFVNALKDGWEKHVITKNVKRIAYQEEYA
jgi:hypothetical protein